jgi:phage-related minor tail protein
MAKPLKVVILGDAKDAKKAFQEISDEANNSSSGLKDFGSKLGGFATAAAGVALGVGAAVGVLFVKGFMDSMESERLNDKLKAQLDLSDEEAAVAGSVAAGVYRDAWGESLGEVNEAVGGIVRILEQDLTEASEGTVRSLTEDALTIRDVWDQDVNEVIRAAGALLDSDLADSAEHAFDIITTGLTEGADLNGDFLDSLFEYSTFFGQAGRSAEQMLSAFIVGTEAGMMGVDKVGDAVKEMSIRIQDGSSASTEALQAIGLDADGIAASFAAGGEAAQQASMDVITALADTEDPLLQTQAAIALLGTPFEDLGVIGPEVLEALASGTLELRDTADVAADAYDNTATSIEEFKRRGRGALEDFVASALAAFGVGGQDGSLKSGIDAINDWITENEDEIKAWGVKFATTVKEVWADTEELRVLLGKIGQWFADSENLDRIQEWASNAQFWIGAVQSAVEFLLAPMLAAAAAIREINSLLGGSPGSKATGAKGTSKGGSTGGGLQVLHSGGFVEGGPVGSERLILAQVGEYVTPIGGRAPGDAVNVVVNVTGSVMTERDLVEAVREGLIRTGRRNGSTGL